MNVLTACVVTGETKSASIDIPIFGNSYIPGVALNQLKIPQTTPPPDTPGDTVPLRLYDPGYKNTIVCKSNISLVEPDGKLFYRGYDVESLVEQCDYLEVSYLLIHGALPNKHQYDRWVYQVLNHTYIHTELEGQMKTFRYDSHPMGMFLATMASLSTFHPEANPALKGVDMYMPIKLAGKEPTPEEAARIKIMRGTRDRAIFRMLGKASTIAANTYRHRIGRPYNNPMPACSNYAENVLYMMDKLNEPDYKPDPRLVRILDKMFILLAEHGSTCSAVMMRHLTSSGVDPYTALAGAGSALFGERKSPAVIEMIKQIESVDKIPDYLSKIKNKEPLNNSKKAPRLLGFGHRIYKGIDPRVKICKGLAFELFDLMGKDSVGTIAVALEEEALKDPWFTERHLYPNIDFWTAIVFHTLGFPQDMFPVWMVLPRVSGFIAHWQESLDDPEYKIYRPRQIYTGFSLRKYHDERLMTPSSSLDARTAKSDPQAALRRTTGDPRTLTDVLALISKTETEIKRVKFDITQSQEEVSTEPVGFTGNALLSLNWIAQQFTQTKSVSDLNKKLDELQLELTQLKEKQRVIVGQSSRGVSPQPDLTAGSRSPRVIDKEKRRPRK